MRYFELIEAPIADIEFHGNMEEPGTFRKDDLKKFNDPVWKDRVLKLFEKAPYDIYVHIINGDENKKVTLRSKYGIDRINTTDFKKYVGIQSPLWAEQIIGRPIDTERKITVFLLQNEGADRVGLTPWMVGHRIAHCFLETNGREANSRLIGIGNNIQVVLSSLFNTLIRSHQKQGIFPSDILNDQAITEIGKLILPFRSAKTGKLSNSGEISVELMTSFLVTGKVRFKRDWIEGRSYEQDLSPLQQAILDIGWGDTPLTSRFERFYYDQETLNNLFRAMAKHPLRPRTKAKLRDEIRIMIDGDLYDNRPNDTWTPSEVAHYHLNVAEKKLEGFFTNMLDYTVGKIVVL